MYAVGLTWFIKKSGHRGFAKVSIPEQYPQPDTITDEDNTIIVDRSVSKEVKESSGGGSYYFSTA